MDLRLSRSVQKVLKELARSDKRRFARVEAAFDKLAIDPRDPSLNTHQIRGIGQRSEWGEKHWIGYVETGVPSAWRFVWAYGPEPDEISVVWLGPHY